jgi:hypothetical protein
MTKVLIVRVEFDDKDWKEISKFYKEKTVRQIILEGGLGELGELVADKQENGQVRKERM